MPKATPSLTSAANPVLSLTLSYCDVADRRVGVHQVLERVALHETVRGEGLRARRSRPGRPPARRARRRPAPAARASSRPGWRWSRSPSSPSRSRMPCRRDRPGRTLTVLVALPSRVVTSVTLTMLLSLSRVIAMLEPSTPFSSPASGPTVPVDLTEAPRRRWCRSCSRSSLSWIWVHLPLRAELEPEVGQLEVRDPGVRVRVGVEGQAQPELALGVAVDLDRGHRLRRRLRRLLRDRSTGT